MSVPGSGDVIAFALQDFCLHLGHVRFVVNEQNMCGHGLLLR
jgi:hypothetical protein